MVISEYINQNLKTKKPQTYGEILNNERGIYEDQLSSIEKQQLNNIRLEDRLRLLKENRLIEQSMIRNDMFNNISGMSGEVKQIL